MISTDPLLIEAVGASNNYIFNPKQLFNATTELVTFSRNVYGFLRILLAEERRATRISFDVSQQVYKVKVECLKIVDGHLVVVVSAVL
jgi:hypothetical protein